MDIGLCSFLVVIGTLIGFFIGRWWAYQDTAITNSPGGSLPNPMDWDQYLPDNLSEEQKAVLRKTLPGYKG